MRRWLWMLPLLACGCGTVEFTPDTHYATPPPQRPQAPPTRYSPPTTISAPPPTTSYSPPRMSYAQPPAYAQPTQPTQAPPQAMEERAPTQSAPTSGAVEGRGWIKSPRLEIPETPHERPGLATSWGEARVSPVREVEFRRASGSPFTTGSVFYNDRSGVDAMASYDVRMSAQLDAPVPISGGITLSVVDESGLPLEAFSLGGRIYVVGENGRRYSIVLSNLTDRRYEAVLSVDGLDVLDGKSASAKKRGYLIGPYATVTVDGFRKSYDEVAAFRFGSVGNSYAARTGSDRNVGVIGFAFYRERGVTPWSDAEIEKRRSADAFGGDRFATSPEGE